MLCRCRKILFRFDASGELFFVYFLSRRNLVQEGAYDENIGSNEAMDILPHLSLDVCFGPAKCGERAFIGEDYPGMFDRCWMPHRGVALLCFAENLVGIQKTMF